MKVKIQYIPLRKIKSDPSSSMTDKARKLKVVLLDCMQLLLVRKNKKDGSYSLLYGKSRLEYLRKYTKKIYVPCIVENSNKSQLNQWVFYMKSKMKISNPNSFDSKSRSIMKSFIKQEPRFKKLPLGQQVKIMFMALRYKQTTISSMRKKVNDSLS